jgi:hypothetical protein
MFDKCQYVDPQTGQSVLTLGCIFPVIANIIFWAFLLAGTVSIVVIMVSGIRLIISGGDAKTVEGAKKALTYAIGGLILVFLSFMILNVIGYITQVTCLNANEIFKGFQSCK